MGQPELRMDCPLCANPLVLVIPPVLSALSVCRGVRYPLGCGHGCSDMNQHVSHVTAGEKIEGSLVFTVIWELHETRACRAGGCSAM